jgi:hypothetical protein
MRTKFLLTNLEGRDYSENLGVDWNNSIIDEDDRAPGMVEIDRRFRSVYCLHI